MNQREKTPQHVVPFCAFGIFLLCVPIFCALDDGVALTPPMGCNLWNKFVGNVSELLIKSAADTMVNNGYLNHLSTADRDFGREKISANSKQILRRGRAT